MWPKNMFALGQCTMWSLFTPLACHYAGSIHSDMQKEMKQFNHRLAKICIIFGCYPMCLSC